VTEWIGWNQVCCTKQQPKIKKNHQMQLNFKTRKQDRYIPFDSKHGNSEQECANCNAGMILMDRIDPESMRRVEERYIDYYKELTGQKNEKQSPSNARYNITYKLTLVQQFVKRFSIVLKRFMLPLIMSSAPFAIYVLYIIVPSNSSLLMNMKHNLLKKFQMIIKRRRDENSAMKQHEFNLIEMLIAISILVTFSSLTSSLYHRKIFSSRVQFTKIQLHLVNQALMLLHAETGVHPLEMPHLEGVETKDAWNNDFIFVPYLDLSEKSQDSARIEKIADIISRYGHAAEILYFASKGEFCFAVGPHGPIFGEEVSDENKRHILSLVKRMRDGSKLKTVIANTEQ
jgi:hypothetical protein